MKKLKVLFVVDGGAWYICFEMIRYKSK